jgi:hypothetical protein
MIETKINNFLNNNYVKTLLIINIILYCSGLFEYIISSKSMSFFINNKIIKIIIICLITYYLNLNNNNISISILLVILFVLFEHSENIQSIQNKEYISGGFYDDDLALEIQKEVIRENYDKFDNNSTIDLIYSNIDIDNNNNIDDNIDDYDNDDNNSDDIDDNDDNDDNDENNSDDNIDDNNNDDNIDDNIDDNDDNKDDNYDNSDDNNSDDNNDNDFIGGNKIDKELNIAMKEYITEKQEMLKKQKEYLQDKKEYIQEEKEYKQEQIEMMEKQKQFKDKLIKHKLKKTKNIINKVKEKDKILNKLEKLKEEYKIIAKKLGGTELSDIEKEVEKKKISIQKEKLQLDGLDGKIDGILGMPTKKLIKNYSNKIDRIMEEEKDNELFNISEDSPILEEWSDAFKSNFEVIEENNNVIGGNSGNFEGLDKVLKGYMNGLDKDYKVTTNLLNSISE